jgi:hypothetical protein
MPIITGMIDSYKIPTNARDLSTAFYLLKYPNTPIFNNISIPGTCSARKREWWDDTLLPSSTTITEAYTAADGSFTFDSTDSVRVGSVFQISGSVYRITAINAKVVTVTIIAADANHADNAKVNFLSTAKIEGATYESSDNATEVLRYNNTQIFDDWLEISGTEEVVNREINMGDLLAQKAMRKMERIYYQMARIVTSGGIRVDASTNADARMMGGIDWFITTYGYNPAAAAFSAANFDTFLYEMEQTYGRTPTEAYMNPVDLQKFTALRTTQITVDRADTGRGEYVDRYQSGYGYDVKLITDPTLLPGKIRVFGMDQLKLLPLQGRSLHGYPLGKLGDKTQWGIVGEYTLEFNNSATTGAFSIS